MNLKCKWHEFWFRLNLQLSKDCLDEREKTYIHSKIEYHRTRMKTCN